MPVRRLLRTSVQTTILDKSKRAGSAFLKHIFGLDIVLGKQGTVKGAEFLPDFADEIPS
jgi:hypothetical protein